MYSSIDSGSMFPQLRRTIRCCLERYEMSEPLPSLVQTSQSVTGAPWPTCSSISRATLSGLMWPYRYRSPSPLLISTSGSW